MTNPADCVLFINEPMAKFCIAWGRRQVLEGDDVINVDAIQAGYSPKELQAMLDQPPHQIKIWLAQAIGVGIIGDGGQISEVAQKCVNTIIAKRLQEMKGN